MSWSYAYDVRQRRSQAVAWPQRLGSAAPIYACDGVTACTVPTLSGTQEEGWYEEASYKPGAGHEEASTEPGLLYQSLNNNETGASLSGNEFEGGSGTVRYVKGGPGGGCARTKKCRRQHEIWSKAGGRGKPTFGEVVEEALEWVGVGECVKNDGDCPGFGGAPGVIRR